MKTFDERYLAALEKDLYELTKKTVNPTEQYRAAIALCKKAMQKLRSAALGYAFENTTEEIKFFKEIKPQFYSRFIYYVNLYNFTVQRPLGSDDSQEAYIRMHLDAINSFFDRNRSFYTYYRSGMTQLDEMYFTRSGFDVHAELEDFEEDQQYATSHDYKLSKLLANEKFQEFLQLELTKLNVEDFSSLGKLFPYKHPQWTASQTDAVELLYALKTGCAVNNGNIDIAELVAIWEFIFQMEINESYHKLLDITRRKKEMFVFLNRLMDSFWNFIKEKFK